MVGLGSRANCRLMSISTAWICSSSDLNSIGMTISQGMAPIIGRHANRGSFYRIVLSPGSFLQAIHLITISSLLKNHGDVQPIENS